jgi:hypothetical protein
VISLSVVLVALTLSAGDEVVARVEGAPITRSQLAARIEASRAQGRPVRAQDALEGMILDALLAREGARAGLGGSKEVAEDVERATRSAAADAFIAEVAAQAKPDEKQLSEMFHATADSASFESLSFGTKDEAAAALKSIHDGAPFSTVAKSAVVARVYPKPESAPLLMRGEIPPELAAALFASAPGQVVGPVNDGIGWSIGRLVKKEIGSAAAFAARRPALVESARHQAQTTLRKHFGEQLRAKAGVKLDEPFLRSLNGLDASPGQLAHPIAQVHGRPVRYEDMYGSLRALATGGRMSGPEMKIQLAWAEIDRRLLEDVAMERGFGRASAVQARQEEFRQLALGRAAVAKIRASAPAPSEGEIDAFYRRNAARYAKPFAQVLPVVAAEAAAEKRARFLTERVQDLRKHASVQIDSKALASAFGSSRR